MSIHVEFYGLARQRAGVGELQIAPRAGGVCLREVLAEVITRVPGFNGCVSDGQLNAALAANLDGNRFVTNPETMIEDGQSLLLFSADAGG